MERKQYMRPETEKVNVRLFGHLLDDDGEGPGILVVKSGESNSENSLSKDFYDDFNSTEDIWDGRDIQMKDVWER